MSDFNVAALISLFIGVISLSVIGFYIIPKQFQEVLRPRDWLTQLRYIILLLFIFSVVAAIPALAYQFLRVFGHQNSALQNTASIFRNLSALANSVLLVLLYNYKAKD